jgi:acetyltransferase-like isoleucine patch superfamily enzyme
MTTHSQPANPPAVERTLELAREHEEAGRSDEARLLRSTLVRGLGRRFLRPAIESAAQWPRIRKYRLLSTCRRVSGTPLVLQPVLFVGPGEVALGEGVQFGWKASPQFYSGYCHVEVSNEGSRIAVGDRTEFNNNLMIKSDGAGISVGRDGLFGAQVEIFDSDFHDLHPARRKTGRGKVAPVEIGDNVFAGMGVRILKGASIGSDSVIGAGAVVTGSIPAGVIAAGNPARVIREL